MSFNRKQLKIDLLQLKLNTLQDEMETIMETFDEKCAEYASTMELLQSYGAVDANQMEKHENILSGMVDSSSDYVANTFLGDMKVPIDSDQSNGSPDIIDQLLDPDGTEDILERMRQARIREKNNQSSPKGNELSSSYVEVDGDLTEDL